MPTNMNINAQDAAVLQRRLWQVLGGSPSDLREVDSVPHATVVAYVAGSNPWSHATQRTLGCLPQLLRPEDVLFLLVDYEAMSHSEQLHHRLNGLPAFKLYSQVLVECMHICKHIVRPACAPQRQWRLTPLGGFCEGEALLAGRTPVRYCVGSLHNSAREAASLSYQYTTCCRLLSLSVLMCMHLAQALQPVQPVQYLLQTPTHAALARQPIPGCEAALRVCLIA